jgi:hypothetical protein
MAINKYFAEWHKAADLEPKADELEKRWQAVEAFVKKIKISNALELVRLFYGRPALSSDFVDTYAAVFQSKDPTFPVRQNALELRVLAGSTIAHLVGTTRTRVTDAVALAMLTSFCQGLRQEVLNADIIDMARSYLAKESVVVRDVAENLNVEEPDVDLEDLLAALTAAAVGSNMATIKVPLTPPFEKLAQAISTLSESVNKIAGEMAAVIKIRREESDILWWVFGGYSRDLGTRISGLIPAFAALVSGKELADLVKLIPGPLASTAFLDKLLDSTDPSVLGSVSIKEGVDATPREWKQDLITEIGELEDLCPLHLALKTSLAVEKASAWLPHFNRSSGLKGKGVMPLVGLANQMYDERMLIRAVRVANS